LKNIIRKLLNSRGLEIRKIDPFSAGAHQRPVGDMKMLLEDLKARGLNCKTIFDVGANRASWSAMAKQVYPEAEFCLIEPQSEMENDLKSFCNHTAGSAYYLAGAGAESIKAYLTVWDDLAGSSFLPPEDIALKGTGKQRELDVITIDSIVESGKFAVPELVKLDIQGYELEALKGAVKLFGTTEAFILEVSLFAFADNPGMPVIAEVINFMLERDYAVYDFPGFARRKLDGALGQCDICFVKNKGFLRASNHWG
jgi:FkbM family methyltransferase